MYLRNYMLTAAKDALEEVLNQDPEACQCDRCKLDMTALMLNKLPPKYVVHDKGYAYSKINELTTQFKVDLTVAAVAAKELVKKSPRH